GRPRRRARRLLRVRPAHDRRGPRVDRAVRRRRAAALRGARHRPRRAARPGPAPGGRERPALRPGPRHRGDHHGCGGERGGRAADRPRRRARGDGRDLGAADGGGRGAARAPRHRGGHRAAARARHPRRPVLLPRRPRGDPAAADRARDAHRLLPAGLLLHGARRVARRPHLARRDRRPRDLLPLRAPRRRAGATRLPPLAARL
ncbi:MAG: hypothetical protein AVDCRST_MAG40-2297, partial [uncultured Gemmatimonadaceae bacterium]